jgi:hypothetical protein
LATGLLAPAAATLAAVLPCLLFLREGLAATWPGLARLGLEIFLFLGVFTPTVLFSLSFCAEEHQSLWHLPRLGQLLGFTRPREGGKHHPGKP